MPITYQHTKNGRLTRVLTPEERASQPGVPDEYRDRTSRRQTQLIRKMDESSKWTRVPEISLLGADANREPAPVVTQVPAETEPTDSDATPEPSTKAKPERKDAEDDKPTGPKFTRVVTKS